MLQAGDIMDPIDVDDTVCPDFDVDESDDVTSSATQVFTGSTINFHDLEQD